MFKSGEVVLHQRGEYEVVSSVYHTASSTHKFGLHYILKRTTPGGDHFKIAHADEVRGSDNYTMYSAGGYCGRAYHPENRFDHEF